MIKETEHFILDYCETLDVFGNKAYLETSQGLVVKLKNTNKVAEPLLYVLPNKQKKLMDDPGTYLQTVGTMLQDTIISWELFVELVKLLDEATWQIGTACVQKDFNKCLD